MRTLCRSAIQLYVRHFPVHTGKRRLIGMIWKVLANGGSAVVASLEQADVKVTCDLNYFIQREIFFFGTYEARACRLWMERAASAKTIFDVGANVGIYSLLAAATNPRARIHSFEPTAEILATFRQNIALNSLSNIIANGVAVGRENGLGMLNKCAGADGTNEGMNFISKQSEVERESQLAVPVVSLKSYCEEHRIEQIDLMKLDIEGGEYDALVGADNLIRQQAIKCIFLELSEWAAERSGHSTRDIKQLLLESGYRLFELRRGELKHLGIEGTNNISSAVALSKDLCVAEESWISGHRV